MSLGLSPIWEDLKGAPKKIDCWDGFYGIRIGAPSLPNPHVPTHSSPRGPRGLDQEGGSDHTQGTQTTRKERHGLGITAQALGDGAWWRLGCPWVPLGALGCPGGMGLKHEVSRYVQVINIDKYWWPSPDMGLKSKCRAWYIFVRWIITDDWGKQSSSHILWLDTLGTSTCPPNALDERHHTPQLAKDIYIYPSFQSSDNPGYVGFCIYAAICIPTKYFRNIVQKISNEINTPTRYAHLPSTWWNRFSIQQTEISEMRFPLQNLTNIY